ncbi:hypothetical protein SETIT_5G158200v2 [Setaria italica]|uniref:BHLH domain-containing protein n=1 Tax=Setaria italica TaxID=4555 RepID=K3XN77_SETIT|nr:uncharacterized protein LOC105914476 [Setaria italica]RCV25337.1 hypothetical protein SETIT_5G158200v2 [Setaria italica]
MAAHACYGGGVAGAAPAAAAARRLKLGRPSRSSLMKARKLRKGGGKCRPRSAASRRKRVEAIRRKMEALRRLVPACEGGDGERADDGRLEELLLHAAGYILRLQMQVRVMQVMVHALNNPPED